jgi:hypothetical protein
MVGGVRQGGLDELEASLLALLTEYEQGDRVRRAAVRRLVILAKDHARWAMRKSREAADKEEMILWMVTWRIRCCSRSGSGSGSGAGSCRVDAERLYCFF